MVCHPYGTAVRLCGIAADRWPELEASYYQIDNLLKLRPRKFINLVYAWCLERVPGDKLDEWKADLADIQPWQDSTSEAAANLESESFMAFMAQGGG